jgi:hypothetical protein
VTRRFEISSGFLSGPIVLILLRGFTVILKIYLEVPYQPCSLVSPPVSLWILALCVFHVLADRLNSAHRLCVFVAAR